MKNHLTRVVELRVEGCWLVNDRKEVSEVFVLTEKLLHAKEQIESYFHGQTSILIEVLMHQEYRIAPAYALEIVIKRIDYL